MLNNLIYVIICNFSFKNKLNIDALVKLNRKIVNGSLLVIFILSTARRHRPFYTIPEAVTTSLKIINIVVR